MTGLYNSGTWGDAAFTGLVQREPCLIRYGLSNCLELTMYF